MNRNPDGAGLISDSPRNGLAYPPCCVSGKLEALGIVEFLNRFDKAEVSFLDKIQKLHPASQIPLCDADDKPQICFRETLFRCLISIGNPDGKIDFLFRREKRHPADFFEVNLDRVVNGNPLGIERRFQVLGLVALCSGKINVVKGFIVKIFYNLDALGFQRVIEFFYLIRVEIQFAEGVQNFFCGKLSLAFPLFNQFLDYCFLIRYRHISSPYFFCCLSFFR